MIEIRRRCRFKTKAPVGLSCQYKSPARERIEGANAFEGFVIAQELL